MSKKLYPQPRAVETVENPLCPGWWAKGVSSQWWITAQDVYKRQPVFLRAVKAS